MGRKPRPIEQKVEMGILRMDRDGDPALSPVAEHLVACPPAPDALLEHGRDAWLGVLPKIIAAGYFTQLDLQSFERYCRAHDEVAKCDRFLLEHNEYTVAKDTGYISQHPAVNQRFKWLDIIRRYEDAFWLNPTSRSGKQISGDGKQSSIMKRRRG